METFLTPVRKYFQGLVTIVIGPSKKEFAVHKDLLSFYSDYFRAAFNGSFVEAIDKRIELHDVDQEVFDNFHGWFYTRKFVCNDNRALGYPALCKLWIFGDRFQTPMLQNCVIDEIFAKRSRDGFFNFAMAKVAYDNTLAGSPLRRAMIEILAYLAFTKDRDNGAVFVSCGGYFTAEILQDLVRELFTARENNVPHGQAPKRDKCFFHVHSKNEHC
ncbi:hypothetical protein E4T52_04055 [Aureobasidium sp. EXF-3400]|nr:hypothetical protein E4T51_06604 [Aureobasidium sp. EXF-12344]KAI4781038.1 hypothetical protein E4T52_04055 [Aureobasidium sp. EXF-3400]